MITEDEQYIFLDNKEDLKKYNILNCSELGSTSNIYKYNNKEILKIFKTPSSINSLNTLEIIKNMNLKSFIIPKKFIFLNQQYYGYSMDYIKGNILIESHNNINYINLLENLNNIEKEIRILSNNNIEITDLNNLNLLFNNKNNKLNIVDLDEYTIRNSLKINELYHNNIEEFKSVFFISICDYFNDKIDKNKLKLLKDYIKSNNTQSLYKTFYNLKNYLENISNNEVLTLKDFRKILVKTNK